MKNLIPSHVRDYFSALEEDIAKEHVSKIENLNKFTVENLHGWNKSADYDAPAKILNTEFEKSFHKLSTEEKSKLKFSLCAKLALNLPTELEKENLPESILNYYPGLFERMKNDIINNHANLEFDPLHKYIKILSAAIVPCGCMNVDLNSRIPITSAILSTYRMRDIRPLTKYLMCGGTGVWFRCHVDTSYTIELNPEGYDPFCLRVAELLRRRPHVKGLAGTGWTLDPILAEISPRMSYLLSLPTARGAFYIKHRTTAYDIENATKTSPTRRRLFEEKKYLPTSYSMIWPRNAILAWAESVEK